MSYIFPRVTMAYRNVLKYYKALNKCHVVKILSFRIRYIWVSFIHGLLIEHLLCAKHCIKC